MILDRASIITIIFVFSLFAVKSSAAQTFARQAWGVDGRALNVKPKRAVRE
jgi:hypothetical protein